MTWPLLILIAYLLGSIPFGLLIGLARGVDVRDHGSQNIGATNVGRLVGRKWGLLALLLDVLKGFAPVLTAKLLFVREPAEASTLLVWLTVAVAAVLGHLFPIYLRFRGGKGVATTVGVALGIYPYFTVAMAAALICYAAVRFSTGWVSAGSLTLAVVFPLALYAYIGVAGYSMQRVWPLQTVALLLGSLIVVRHRTNIVRLLRGQEARLTRDG